MLKLLMEALPCSLIWKCYAYIVGIWQLMQTMFQQGDATFKAWQHIVTKIEPFLRPFNSQPETFHQEREAQNQ
jgi:hypothetical protein